MSEKQVANDRSNVKQEIQVNIVTEAYIDKEISYKTRKLAQWVFLFFGNTALLPIYCLIIPVDYWFNQYPSTIITSISVTNNIFNSIITFLMMKFSYALTVRFRILLSLTI